VSRRKLEVHICTCHIYPSNTGQVRIWRSSDLGQGDTKNCNASAIFIGRYTRQVVPQTYHISRVVTP